MKAAATLLALVLASCAMGSELDTPATATVEDHATTRLPSVNTSCLWFPDGTCYGQRNDGNNIWPSDVGITRLQVLLRGGPDRLEHRQQTYLAFVIWNGSTIGRIFQVDLNTESDVNFQDTLRDISARQTMSIFDSQTTMTGSTVGTPSPPPHPNVLPPIVFEQPYLDVVRRQASIIDQATATFLSTRAAGID
jgi:hypothetical protein